jgi:hypothetical protein
MKTMNGIITPERHAELKARIQPLRQRVETWRANKSGNEHMPAALWTETVELAKLYGVSPVQKILRVDYRGLERRAFGIVKPVGKAESKARASQTPARPAPPSFVELGSWPARRAEHLVELEDGSGRKLSLKVAAGHLAEVLPLAQAFWRP